MHLEDGHVPVFEGHLVERAVAQDARVADHTVHGPELVDRRLDDVLSALGLGDGVVVGDRTTAGFLDLGDHLVGHGRPGTGSVRGIHRGR